MRSLILLRLLPALIFSVAFAKGDVLNLVNGDRFIGEIESMDKTEIHIKNDVVGVIKVPRAKVASIFLGTNQPPAGVGVIAATQPSVVKTQIDPGAVDQVQKEFLATASPEANAMFTDLVQGLSSGKLSIEDIRKQARDSLRELRELQAEIGEEDDNPLLSSYVGILERFVNQGSTNRAKVAPAAPAPAPKPAPDDE